jgi:thioredoxin reductase
MSRPPNTVAVIGAGPVGLAAAAHLLERGLRPVVLEAGTHIGHAVRQWSHVRMFSPWSFNVDKAAARLLAEQGWHAPDPDHYPTGGELVERYLEPLGTRTRLNEHVLTKAQVISVARAGFDKVKSLGRDKAPFAIKYQNRRGPETLPETLLADAVIDASGTWHAPNPAGSNGTEAIGEAAHRGRIAYAMPDVLGRDWARYAGRIVGVLGAGHSAIGTLLDLAKLREIEPATQIIWMLRAANPEKSFGGGTHDKLAARGELGRLFAQLVHAGGVRVESCFGLTHITGGRGPLHLGAGAGCCGRQVEVDELIVATGFRPDLSFLRELRLALDPALECPPLLAPLIDPNVHSCGTVRPHGARELAQPEPGFYIAGMKSYGRAPTFLMLTGYEQVRSIVADLAGDKDAARRVELELPETGVCSRPLSAHRDNDGCCGGPAPIAADACCLGNAGAEAAGALGRGCR